jgi:hypothetical protein
MIAAFVRRDGASRPDYVRGRFPRATLFLLVAFALIAPGAAAASTYRWQVDASGNWNDPSNWAVVEGPAGAGYPNLPGDAAVIDGPLTADRTITIPTGVTITIGRLTVDQSVSGNQLTIARTGTGLLVFDNLGEDALIETSGLGDRMIMSTPIQLAAHLVVHATIEFSGISESLPSRNVTVTGRSVTCVQANTYTGTTTVTQGQLVAEPAAAMTIIPGPLVIGDGAGAAASAEVIVLVDAISHSADVQVNSDGQLAITSPVAPREHTIDSLTVAGGSVLLIWEGTTLTVQDLTMEGGEVRLHPDTGVRLTGALTATSTAVGPARVLPASTTGGALVLLPGSHDFTIADGPQAIDLQLDGANVLGESAPGAGLSKKGPGVMQIGGNALYTGATSAAAGELIVTGDASSSPFTVAANAVLSGTGKVGPVTAATNGTVSPGLGTVGAFSSGSIAFTNNTQFQIEILGARPPAGAGSDRLNVTGTVNLGNAHLALISDLLIPPVSTFLIVDNDGNDPVIGTFLGLPEGDFVITESNARFRISYQGGDGNDVVLVNDTPVQYILSEGATGTFFDEDVLIANPNTVPAPITLTFFLPDGSNFAQQRTVPAQSRITVKVDEIPGLAQTALSVSVLSDNRLPLAVERTMFWDPTHYGGHTAAAVPQTERQWLFAEGAQGFFDTYLLLVNANSFALDATVTFLRENAPPIVEVIPMAAFARVTVHAGDYPALADQAFGMKVEAPHRIGAERSMYFASTPSRLWTGGHANAGISSPATEWFHAEGASGTFFNTFILIGNPQTTPAEVRLRFLLQDGGAPIELTKVIPPQGRLTVNPAAEGEPRLQNAAFSTVVTSDVPVVSERAMYWPTDVPFGEGHASSGVQRAALSWVLAEGRVGGPDAYTTYILLANPNATAAEVTVRFLRENDTPVEKTYTVPGNTRFNIDVGGMVPEMQNESFGARVEVTNNVPIAVERSMYWNVNGVFWQGGTNAVAGVIP